MQKPHRIAALLLALPGLVVPFLPFISSSSPLDVMLHVANWILSGYFGWFVEFGLLAAPSLLALPIAIWQARKLFSRRLISFEIAAAYALSAGAMILVLCYIALYFLWARDPQTIAMTLSCWLLVIANVALLWRNRTRRISPEVRAEVFLLGGYLPNAAFSLLGFGWGNWSNLQAGAWTALAACVAYVISIALALRSDDAASPSKATT